MRKFKMLSALVFAIIAIILVSNTKCYAAGIQYTANLIPTMTSNTAPSGVASASNSYSSSNLPYKAFDKSPMYGNDQANIWGTNSVTGWIAYEFNTPKTITMYTIQTTTVPSYINTYAKNWTFEAWDGSKWVVLDTRTNITWTNGQKKEFTFSNSISYKKYRLNISANNGSTTNQINLMVGEIEMMESIVSAPANLVAEVDNMEVNLLWNAVADATSYNIKRSETHEGPYVTISSVSGSAITFTDVNVENNKTYYYVISTIISGIESTNSNEVSVTIPKVAIGIPTNLTATVGDEKVILTWSAVNGATCYNIKYSPTAGGPYNTITTDSDVTSYTHIGLNNGTAYFYVVSAITPDGESADSIEVTAIPQREVITGSVILDIYMDNGSIKEYNLTGEEFLDFLGWYDNRLAGVAKSYYIFDVKGSTIPFISIKNYIPYDKILCFDVKEYSE